MRSAFLVCLTAFLTLAPAAVAGTVSGTTTGSRLDVTFRAAAGETNEMRVLPHASGVRMVDAGADIQTGEHCLRVNDHDARCGPPGPEGLVVAVFTGDRRDGVYTANGSVRLGRGKDFGIAYGDRGSLHGDAGDDELRALGIGARVAGGPGRDELIGFGRGLRLEGGLGPDFIVGRFGNDRLEGGRGRDQIVGGRGRDRIVAGPGDDFIRASDAERDLVRCGSGRDRAFVRRADRVRSCERVTLGWPD
jgi:Ca2+-binding RTX toxin-like protein